MTNTLQDSFACRVSMPIATAEERCFRYVPAVAIFRRIPPEMLDTWLMPDGKARGDRELASEVLIEVRHAGDDSGATPQRFDLSEVLEVGRAASLFVSTFLSSLPRP
ncbi:hypothetical protein [Variovorax sp.]|uniref:hypothetical protein n=2 Tax=Comamonadaceae TaxID=80864 RepID=UPI000ABC865F|nr:hypothetical protein [Variovorax sp.]